TDVRIIIALSIERFQYGSGLNEIPVTDRGIGSVVARWHCHDRNDHGAKCQKKNCAMEMVGVVAHDRITGGRKL
ncbi:MAG: hypothetical protein ACR2OX_09680, partial [Methyloligellaceae bacterium]